MAQIELEDGSRYEVDDAFFDLPEEEQQQLLRQLQQSGPEPSEQPQERQTTTNPLRGAAQQALNIKANLNETGELVGDVITGGGKLAAYRLTGDPRFIQNNPFEEEGRGARKARETREGLANAPQFEQAVSLEEAVQNPLGFQEGSVLPNIVKGGLDRAIAGAPSIAMVAGPQAAVGLPSLAVSTQRDIAEERARRDGRESGNTQDYTIGALAAAPSVLLERIGVKGTAGILKQAPVQAALNRVAATTAGRITQSAATEGATEALQGGIEELASGLGTEEGTSGRQVILNALDQAYGGVAGGAALRGTIESGEKARNIKDRMDTQQLLQQTPDQLAIEEAAMSRLEQERESVKANNRNYNPLRDDTKVARGAAEAVAKDVQSLIRGLEEAGDLTQDNRALISDLGEAKTITEEGGDTSEAKGVLAKALNQQRKLGEDDLNVIRNLPIREEDRATIEQSLRVIDTLTGAGIKRDAASGPTSTALGLTGGAAGSIIGFNVGSSILPGAGVPFAGAGATAGFTAGSKLGRGLDQIMGLGQPKIVAQTKARRRLLEQQDLQVDNVAATLSQRVEQNKQIVADLERDRDALIQRKTEMVEAGRQAEILAQRAIAADKRQQKDEAARLRNEERQARERERQAQKAERELQKQVRAKEAEHNKAMRDIASFVKGMNHVAGLKGKYQAGVNQEAGAITKVAEMKRRALKNSKQNPSPQLRERQSQAEQRALQRRKEINDARMASRNLNNIAAQGVDAVVWKETGLRPRDQDAALNRALEAGEVSEKLLSQFYGDPKSMEGSGGLVQIIEAIRRDNYRRYGRESLIDERLQQRTNASRELTVELAKEAKDLAMSRATSDQQRLLVNEVARAKSRPLKRAIVSRALDQHPEMVDFIERFVVPMTEYGPIN